MYSFNRNTDGRRKDDWGQKLLYNVHMFMMLAQSMTTQTRVHIVIDYIGMVVALSLITQAWCQCSLGLCEP